MKVLAKALDNFDLKLPSKKQQNHVFSINSLFVWRTSCNLEHFLQLLTHPFCHQYNRFLGEPSRNLGILFGISNYTRWMQFWWLAGFLLLVLEKMHQTSHRRWFGITVISGDIKDIRLKIHKMLLILILFMLLLLLALDYIYKIHQPNEKQYISSHYRFSQPFRRWYIVISKIIPLWNVRIVQIEKVKTVKNILILPVTL